MEILFFILFVVFLYYYGKTILTVLLALVAIGLVYQVARTYPGATIAVVAGIIALGVLAAITTRHKQSKPNKALEIKQDAGLWCDQDTGCILQVPEQDRPFMRRLAHDCEDAIWLVTQSHDGTIVRAGISDLAYWLADNWGVTALTAFVYVPEWFAEHPEKIDELAVIPDRLLCA